MRHTRRNRLLGGAAMTAALAFAGAAMAQDAAPGAQDPEVTEVDDIVVVGSNIRGARTTAALPVVVVDEAQVDATGAVSGDELMRTIPQMGDVLFDSSNNPQTSNAARGDVNSVNLRSLGVGNTLVLLNGRRVVQHPTSQGTSDTGTVPVLSYNSNAIPVAGLRRTEILLDGAAAIYGADAVAGVVNTVLRDNYEGLTISARYGGAEGTSMEELDVNLFAGKNFDRGNLSVFVNYTDRTALLASDQEFTQSRRSARSVRGVSRFRRCDRAGRPFVEHAVGASERRRPADHPLERHGGDQQLGPVPLPAVGLRLRRERGRRGVHLQRQPQLQHRQSRDALRHALRHDGAADGGAAERLLHRNL